MPAVSAGDVLLVTLKGDLNSQTILNTFHFGMETVTGAPTQAAVSAEILTKLAAAGGFYDKFLDCCPQNYALTEVWVQFILDQRYRKVVATPGIPGTFPFNAETTNQAAVISRFGAAANKRNVGSVHIPIGGSSNFLSGGYIAAGLNTALGLFAPYLYTPLTLATLGTLQPILIHGDSKLNAIPLVSAQVQVTARTMRRRTVGLGI